MTTRPNVILINCDDLGYGDLGCYGSTLNRTPAIDRLAAEGVRFTDFYASSPVCSPSRAALLTGCYPTRVGFGSAASGPLGGVLFPGWSVGLHPNEVTLARLLSDAGYATKLVGKWHVGDQPEFLPTAHGFDEYYGLPYSNDMGRQALPDRIQGLRPDEIEPLLRRLGCEEAWIRPPLPLLADDEVLEEQPDQASLTGRYLEQAIRFLRSNHGRPFFLYLAHLYVHLPIYVQERFRSASQNGEYGAAVECIDWVTAVLMDELGRLGLDERTIVVFTSDNGALAVDKGGSGSNAPLRGAKGQTWEGGQRVAGIVRWVGTIPAGIESDAVAAQIDLYPTIAALCGAELPDDRIIDGVDLRSELGLDGPPIDVDRPFLYISGPNIEAVRVGRWKLHVLKDGRDTSLLFDVGADPGETNDVAAQHPDVVGRLAAVLHESRLDLGDGRSDVVGSGTRPIGQVPDPKPLTEFDPSHPYFIAEYDLTDLG